MSVPTGSGPSGFGTGTLPGYSVVIPTIGRPNLANLLQTLDHAAGPRPEKVIIVDDRSTAADQDGGKSDLELPAVTLPITVLQTGGRGPAAARNVGWRAAQSDWIAFLDDDVVISHDWPQQLVTDLGRCSATEAGSAAVIMADAPPGRGRAGTRRSTTGLAEARWITADLAFRRTALAEVDGFDETFRRAYREDSDLALRMIKAGYQISTGRRATRHPVLDADQGNWLASVRRELGNSDDALMLARHGRTWRKEAGAGRGLIIQHSLTTLTGITSVGLVLAGRRRAATVAAAGWAVLTAQFAIRRILAGPRTGREIGRVIVSSALIPPVASFQRIRGELAVRRTRPRRVSH